MIKPMTATIIATLLVGGCSQAGNVGNSLGIVWVGPGTSATLTINAQTTTVPASAPIIVPRVVP